MNAIEKQLPLHVTDLQRICFTENQEVRKVIQEGIAREGSNTDAIFTDVMSWQSIKSWLGREKHEVVLGVLQVRDLLTLLPLRLGFGRGFTVFGKSQSLKLLPSEAAGVLVDSQTLCLSLPKDLWAELLSVLRAETGEYSFPSLSRLAIRVVPNQIRNAKGEVVQTIG